jgi:hypothetical protein
MPVPPVRHIWDTASTVPSATLSSRLEDAGVALHFELPYALRYLDASPWDADAKAPVVLMRLATTGTPFAGYASLNLDTLALTEHRFEGIAGELYGSIWAEKSQTLVAASLRDAVALNRRFKCPVIVTPTPAALQAYRPRSALSCLVYALPNALSPEWRMALQEAVAEVGPLVDKVVCVEPGDEARDWTWADYLADLGSGNKVMKRSIMLDEPAPDALAELLS